MAKSRKHLQSVFPAINGPVAAKPFPPGLPSLTYLPTLPPSHPNALLSRSHPPIHEPSFLDPRHFARPTWPGSSSRLPLTPLLADPPDTVTTAVRPGISPVTVPILSKRRSDPDSRSGPQPPRGRHTIPVLMAIVVNPRPPGFFPPGPPNSERR